MEKEKKTGPVNTEIGGALGESRKPMRISTRGETMSTDKEGGTLRKGDRFFVGK